MFYRTLPSNFIYDLLSLRWTHCRFDSATIVTCVTPASSTQQRLSRQRHGSTQLQRRNHSASPVDHHQLLHHHHHLLVPASTRPSHSDHLQRSLHPAESPTVRHLQLHLHGIHHRAIQSSSVRLSLHHHHRVHHHAQSRPSRHIPHHPHSGTRSHSRPRHLLSRSRPKHLRHHRESTPFPLPTTLTPSRTGLAIRLLLPCLWPLQLPQPARLTPHPRRSSYRSIEPLLLLQSIRCSSHPLSLSLSPFPLSLCLIAKAIAWHYEGATLSLRSSLTIGSDGLAMGQTYQFMVIMQSRRNSSIRSVGYLLVRMQNINVPTISVR